MGLRINELDRLLRGIAETGIPKNAITIGRMDVFVGWPTIAQVCRNLNLPFASPEKQCDGDTRIFLDQVLKKIGVEVVDSIDYSDFEGATVIHDLGKALPEVLKTYDLVYESGTIEHIYNFPVALENILSLCGLGGRVLLNTPCNNQAGHGFYQFSPELFFSAFRKSEFFNLESVEVYEDFDQSPRYKVTDPLVMRSRVEIRSILPLNMTVALLRVAKCAPQEALTGGKVMQTDYVYAWKQTELMVKKVAAAGKTYSPGQLRQRVLLLKIDGLLNGFVRLVVSMRRRSFYIGAKRKDIAEIKTRWFS